MFFCTTRTLLQKMPETCVYRVRRLYDYLNARHVICLLTAMLQGMSFNICASIYVCVLSGVYVIWSHGIAIKSKKGIGNNTKCTQQTSHICS